MLVYGYGYGYWVDAALTGPHGWNIVTWTWGKGHERAGRRKVKFGKKLRKFMVGGLTKLCLQVDGKGQKFQMRMLPQTF